MVQLLLLEARVSVWSLGVGLSRLDLDDDDDVDVVIVIVNVMGYVALLQVAAGAFSPCILTGGVVKGVGVGVNVSVSVGVAKSKTIKRWKKQTQKTSGAGRKMK